MKYAKKAAWWLRPLLERYFEKRKRIGVSEYLFVGRYQMTQNRPVCDTQILDLVQRASQRVLNGVVNPRDLRGTVAAIRADTSKRRGAILTHGFHLPDELPGLKTHAATAPIPDPVRPRDTITP